MCSIQKSPTINNLLSIESQMRLYPYYFKGQFTGKNAHPDFVLGFGPIPMNKGKQQQRLATN
jgi:hypothetical protein